MKRMKEPVSGSRAKPFQCGWGCRCLRTTVILRRCSAGRPSVNYARDLPQILLIATSTSGLPQSTARRPRRWQMQTVAVRTAQLRRLYSRDRVNALDTGRRVERLGLDNEPLAMADATPNRHFQDSLLTGDDVGMPKSTQATRNGNKTVELNWPINQLFLNCDGQLT